MIPFEWITSVLILLLSRDDLVRNLYRVISTSALANTGKGADNRLCASCREEKVLTLTFQNAVELIEKFCPVEFLNAVKDTGAFLYRGETFSLCNNNDSCYQFECPPDLLSQGTYGCAEAVEYFQRLEDCSATSSSLVRPSTGHIGTSSIRSAAQWGNPVSVWPLGTSFSYAFPMQRSDFFHCGDVLNNKQSPTPCDEIYWNKELSKALRADREVMFATLDSSGKPSFTFIACPAPLYNQQLIRFLVNNKNRR